MDQCLTCHGASGQKPVPSSHASFTVDTCQNCHGLDDSGQGGSGGGTAAGPKIPHSIAAPQDQCLTCHAAGGLKPFPANHAAFTVDNCQTCHQLED